MQYLAKPILILTAVFMTSCLAIVRPGEVGIKQKLGHFKNKTYREGTTTINPFTTRFFTVSTRTENMVYSMDLPTKEGLTVQTVVSLLFHVEADSARRLIETVGLNYEEKVIRTIFRSAARDVSSRFLAKDLHTAGRAEIESEIEKSIKNRLQKRGIIVEAVLLKSVTLPPSLRAAIESKLSAEQDAQRMQFILQREKQEAERKRIEAKGISDYQKIIKQELSEIMLKYESIEAFKELSRSSNAKVIITDGKAPYLISE